MKRLFVSEKEMKPVIAALFVDFAFGAGANLSETPEKEVLCINYKMDRENCVSRKYQC
jgi:hypothetical protein